MEEGSRYRQFSGWLKRAAGAVLLIFGLYHILYAIGLFDSFGMFVPSEAIRALSLAFILSATFLFFPASKRHKRSKLPWYDVVLAVVALIPGLYFVIRFHTFLVRFGLPTVLEVVLGSITLALIFEGLRRSLGWILVGLVGFFLFYSFYGNYFPGILRVSGHTIDQVVGHLWLSNMGIYGLAMNVFVNYIYIFLLFSAFLGASGATDFFIKLASSLVGGTRGGPAKVSVIASAMFGTVSGSAVANVMATGVFTIPMMKRMGFKPVTAGAVEAAASTGGQLVPPVLGVAAFVMADFLEIPYMYICLLAVVPAFLYYLSLFISVHLEAVKLGLRGMPKEELPSFGGVLKDGWFYALPLILLIVLLGPLHYTVLKACLYATAATILISWLSREKKNHIGIKGIPKAIKESSHLAIDNGVMFGGVGIIIASVGLTGIALRLSSQLLALAMGMPFLVFLYVAIICLILGMGLGTLPSYVLLAVIVGPAISSINIGVIPAHFFIFYYAVIGMITPPVCFAAYAGAMLAGAPPFVTGFTAMRLGAVSFLIPFAFVFDNGLLLMGTPLNILLAVAAAGLGILLITVAHNGYMRKDVNWLIRLIFFLAGVSLLVPTVKLYALPVGIIMLAMLWLWQRRRIVTES